MPFHLYFPFVTTIPFHKTFSRTNVNFTINKVADFVNASRLSELFWDIIFY